MTRTNIVQGPSVDPYDVWLLVMNSLNIFLHAFGFILLLYQKHGEIDVQRIYLINLSVTDFLKNLFIFLTVLPDVIPIPNSVQHSINEAHIYIGIVYDYGVMCSFYLTMFCVTLDRYFFISWNDAYKVHWKYKQAKYLMMLIWGLGTTLSVIISLVYKFAGADNAIKYFLYVNNTESLVIAYCRPFIDIPFVLLAIVVYYKIFRKFFRSQRRISASTPYRKQKQKHESSFTIFIHSRFLITALLIGSFIFFTFIPDMIFTYYAFTHRDIAYQLEAVCYILFAISDIGDAIIYIFIKNEVRKFLLEKLGRCRRITEEVYKMEMDTSNTVSVTGGNAPMHSSTLI